MLLIGRFVTEKIPVGTGGEKFFIAFSAVFPEGQRDGTVGEILFKPFHRVAYHFLGKDPFPALKHKGAKAKLIPLRRAKENFLL